LSSGRATAGRPYLDEGQRGEPPRFAELAAWCAGPLDRVAAGLPPERVAARERAFRTNLDHELAFWDA
jgi:thiaminase